MFVLKVLFIMLTPCPGNIIMLSTLSVAPSQHVQLRICLTSLVFISLKRLILYVGSYICVLKHSVTGYFYTAKIIHSLLFVILGQSRRKNESIARRAQEKEEGNGEEERKGR